MTASEERESLPNEKQPAAMANSHPPALHSQVADLRIADSQNLANANYSNLPLLWQPAVKDARAAKRNKWRGPVQRGGGRLCRLRVSLRAGCQSSTQEPTFFLASNHNPKRSQNRISRAKPVASITLLSRVVDFFRECSVAVGTTSGRSQQPRSDRFQDLLQRQTRSFFCLDGQDEQVSDGTHDEMMVKAAPRSAFIVIDSQIVFGTLEILFNVPTRTTRVRQRAL